MSLSPKDYILDKPVGLAHPHLLKREYFIPGLAGLLALGGYIATLAPTVTSEDSGELIGAAYFFGVPHPPGYPLWTMLCGLFVKLFPAGNIAWRANLFSAVCAALAILILCRTLMVLGLRPWAALAGALTCAFGRVLWSQSVITEVYTLHFLVFILIIWSVVHWHRSQQGKWLCLASLLLGLGMSNHQTIGYTGVAVTTWVLLQKPQLLKHWRLIAISTVAFLAGLLPHTYMYIRAQANPPVNWGETKTVQALWDHVSRRQYRSSDPQTKQPERGAWAHLKGEFQLIGEYCHREYTVPLAAIGLIGLALMSRPRYRKAQLLLLLLLVCNAGIHILATRFEFTTRLDRWTNQVFFLPVFACLAITIAYALDSLLAMCRLWIDRRGGLWPRLLQVTALLLTAIVMVTPAIANLHQSNMRHYWYAYDHAKNILDTVLPGGLIIPSGDHNTFPLLYLVLIEKYRDDVIIADKYGYIDPDLYQEMPNNPGKPRTLADRDTIEEWLIRHARRPVYYTAKRQSLVPNAHMVHIGVLYHLLPETKTLDTESIWSKYHYRNLEGLPAPRDFGADNILADWEYFQGLRELESKSRDIALKHFTQSQEYGWGIKELANNIGSALAEHGYTEDALAYYTKASDMDKRYEAPRWNMARLCKSLKQYDKAEKVFEELAAANPDDFRVWGELGFLAAGDGRWQEAVAHWNASLRLNPDQRQIIEQLHNYYSLLATGTDQASIAATSDVPTSAELARSTQPSTITATLPPIQDSVPEGGE